MHPDEENNLHLMECILMRNWCLLINSLLIDKCSRVEYSVSLKRGRCFVLSSSCLALYHLLCQIYQKKMVNVVGVGKLL